MGKHLTQDGEFQSDKNPRMPRGKIVLSFDDPAAREGLKLFAYYAEDRELAADVLEAVRLKEVRYGHVRGHAG